MRSPRLPRRPEVHTPACANVNTQLRNAFPDRLNVSREPRSNRLILATTTPRTVASARPSSQAVNAGSGLIERMA